MWRVSYVRTASDQKHYWNRQVELRQPVLPLLRFCPLTYTLDQTSEEKGKLFLTSLATNSNVVGI